MVNKKKIFGIRLSALIETLVFLLAIVLYDCLLGKCDRFLDSSPHPFSVVILIITVQYGTAEGIASVILSTLFLYAGNIPEHRIDETLFEYQFRIATLPLAWFIAAFVIGEIRMRLEYTNERLSKKLEETRGKLRTVSKEFSLLKSTKENLEAHLVSQQRSQTATYAALQALETLNPTQILLKVEDVVTSLLNIQKFSVYAKGEQGFEVVTSYCWKREEPYLLRIEPEHPLFIGVAGERRILCAINPDDEKALGNEGVLAAPLIDNESGEIFGMLKIEEIDFMELNLSSLESFRSLCHLIGSAYARARRYQKVKHANLSV